MTNLAVKDLGQGYKLDSPKCDDKTNLESPAPSVMTDFRKTAPRMLEGGVKIDQAKTILEKEHARSKIVITEKEKIIGMINLSDLNGSRAILAAKEQGGRDQLRVRDVMTKAQDLKAVHLSDLKRSKVRDVVDLLKEEQLKQISL